MPTFVPPVGTGTGGQVIAIPTAAPSVVIDRTNDAPFSMSLRVPLPPDGLPGQVIRIEQLTALPTSVALPGGVTTAKIIQIDVYDSSTGDIVHDHFEPLEIAVQLSEAEKALCRTNPSQIALLHIDADNTVTRVPLLSLNCDTGIMRALLYRTSSYAVASMLTSTSISFRYTFPSSVPGRGTRTLRPPLLAGRAARPPPRTDRSIDRRIPGQLSPGVQPRWRDQQRLQSRKADAEAGTVTQPMVK